ncbi:hypothetical protein, conserved [Eimeria tenella]|uniref:Uncharacterized protein n=1 Tax=Eimeria tenella TaxID=5802 RepID=U6KW16_EIMTE|nr:hypothetical protein, conserved [Eimeria tenella]CDJ42327.1 hypothetical protein, conserved [Eimeria tenella]|eukprot:XP_013233077.1 hypothetical protein, conserved [Eimeria tenella]
MASQSSLQEIGEATDAVFASLHLRPFLLRLPLPAGEAAATIRGICEKVTKNKSASHTRSNPLDAATEQPDAARAEQQVEGLRQMLSSQSVAGFVLVLVEAPQGPLGGPQGPLKGPQGPHYCPVAGGIVEVVDPVERSVRAIWCRRSLPAEVSEVIMRTLSLRLFAYGFASSQQMVPSSLNKDSLSPSKTPVANRLISCTQESMFLFPRDATAFMKTQLCMSRHWETPLDGGSHIDHPKAPCRCSSVRNVAGAWQFSGISLSRFVNYWRNHGRVALLEVPSSALGYFALHDRPGQGLESGAKRQRRRAAEAVKTEEAPRTPPQGGAAGAAAAKELQQQQLQQQPASEAGEVIAASSRRGLRRECSIPPLSHHGGAQRRQAKAARMGAAAGPPARGAPRPAEGAPPPAGQQQLPRHRQPALPSRPTARANGPKGLRCAGVATDNLRARRTR